MSELPFVVLRRLGQGAMAEVLLARWSATGARVAIKRVLPPLRRNTKILALFREEARLLARLHHENIPALVGADASAPEPWLALEHVDGADLAMVQRALSAERKRWPLADVVAVARAVAAALAHAHALKDDDGALLRVVHRDVSPSNVLLSVGGAVKLTDFGVARHEGRPTMTRTGALVGKLAYMAPEQLRGGKVDARTDVFGWGVLLYEMITGALPFDRDSTEVHELGSVRLQPLSSHRKSVDKQLAAVVERALEPEPARRYADGAALCEALASLPAATPAFTALVQSLAVRTDADERETLADTASDAATVPPSTVDEPPRRR